MQDIPREWPEFYVWVVPEKPFLILAEVKQLTEWLARGRLVTTMDFKSSCKICQPICSVKIDNFDLYLRWVYSNEKHNFSYINNYKNDERIKILKEQLKTLLKLLCPHPDFAVNIFYSYNFFLDNWVSFWNGLAYLLSVCGIDLEDK